MEIAVYIVVGFVFTVFGIGILYMLFKDFGIEKEIEEARIFISFIDKVIANLKKVVKPNEKAH